MSCYKDLENLIDSIKKNPTQDFSKVDEVFNKIVAENHIDLLKSMKLLESFFIDTLDGQESFKKVA